MNLKHCAKLMLAMGFMTAASVFAAPDPNFHIYLAFGQSNMEGQGNIEQQDKSVDKRFQMMATVDRCNGRTLGTWNDAVPPLANCSGKLGPADYFGRTMVEKTPEGIKIGVIVVAVAGCDIGLFSKDNYRNYTGGQSWYTDRVNAYGGNPYGRLIEMAKKAQQDGVIKGVIFHQGETNAGDGNWPSNVKKVYDNIIKDLGLGDDIPFLAGEVLRSGSSAGANNNIAKLPQQSKNFYVISSEGFNQALGDGQNVHFTSQEYRDFGKRYAEKMLQVLGEINVVGESSSSEVVQSSSSVATSSATEPASSATVPTSSISDETGIPMKANPKMLSVGEAFNKGKNVFVPVNLARAGVVKVAVYSSLGKVLFNSAARYDAGENLISLSKKSLPVGAYMLSVQVDGTRIVKSFDVNR